MNLKKRLETIERKVEAIPAPSRDLPPAIMEKFVKRYDAERERRLYGRESLYWRAPGLEQRKMEKEVMRDVMQRLYIEDEEYRNAYENFCKGGN